MILDVIDTYFCWLPLKPLNLTPFKGKHTWNFTNPYFLRAKAKQMDSVKQMLMDLKYSTLFFTGKVYIFISCLIHKQSNSQLLKHQQNFFFDRTSLGNGKLHQFIETIVKVTVFLYIFCFVHLPLMIRSKVNVNFFFEKIVVYGVGTVISIKSNNRVKSW